MKHIVLLLKNHTLRYGVCHEGNFEFLRYQGAEEVPWRTERPWKQFWEYVKANVRLAEWRDMRLSLLHLDCPWETLRIIVDVPLRQGVGGFRIQSVQEVLPELACKGMLLGDKPVRLCWEGVRWEVSPTSVSQVAAYEGQPPLEISDGQLLHTFAAPWPLKAEVQRAPVQNPASLRPSPLPAYINASKIIPK